MELNYIIFHYYDSQIRRLSINIENIKEFVSDALYQDLCLNIRKIVPINIVSIYSDTMAFLDLMRMSNADLSIKELHDVILSNKDGLIKFSVNKFKKTHGIEEIEDYPSGEEIEEKPITIESSGYSQGFLLMNLIEYILAKKGVNELEEYLKKSRIPQAKKYTKDVFSFLSE